jgi:predicted Zn finger-like uncharacterized protein
MLIVCPNCATSYDVEVASLRPNGRRVRCVRCRVVWHAELPHAEKLTAAAEALGPDRQTAAAAAETAEAAAETAEAEHATADAPMASGSDWPMVDAEAEAGLSGATEAEAGPEAEPANEVESPSIAPGDFETGHGPIDVEPGQDFIATPEDIESVAARRVSKRAERSRWFRPSLSRLQMTILALIVIDAIVVGWRNDFVRAMPQTASFFAAIGMPVNLRGLTFDKLATSTEEHERVPILVLDGDIINVSRKIIELPHLRFAVRNAAHEEIYSWTAAPPRTLLPPGEAVAFRTRLASPPPDAHDVLVRFLNRRDVMTGAR